MNTKKSIISWSLYDWANSVFATSVISVFFPLFFNEFWSHGADTISTTARLGIANAISGGILVILAPFIGTIADNLNLKKKFLTGFIILGSLMTSALFFVPQGSWIQASFFFILATIGFSGGNIFYDALLTSICSKDKMNYVSALGFSLGYLGGAVLLIIQSIMYKNWEIVSNFLELKNKNEVTLLFFLITGIWWLLFSLPIILYVKEQTQHSQLKNHIIKLSYQHIILTLNKIKQDKTIFYFLMAYFVYIDGVDTIIRMAIDYGVSLNLNQNDLIGAFILTQFIGFPSSLLMAWLSYKFDTKKIILLTICIYGGVSIFGVLIKNTTQFYILAIIIGLVQGGIQALSRSYYAKLIPVENSAEYFGIYNMIGKFSVIFGPLIVGTTGIIFKNFGYNQDISTRAGIGSIIIFFIIGGIIFYFGQKSHNSNKE